MSEEDGSEFVTGPHVSGHNGSFRPFPTGPSEPGVRCPPAIAERLARLRAEAQQRAELYERQARVR